MYSFNENLQWEDMGTGHISMNFIERLQSLTLIVRSEEDGSVLLESKILPDRAYQKQEETLIVWTEDDSCDLALSFQEKAGCDDLWATICEIQGRNPSVLVTQDIGEDLSDRFDESSVSVELPPCELSKLNDIFELVTSAIPSTVQRESLALAIEKEGYIAKLLDLFHVCEDLENTEGLHYIYKIFRTIFLLNKPSLLGMMFADDTIMDVIGCLEYDPAKPHPVRHREYLKKISQHREVIPFNNPQLLAKIHQTYKVQYIQEVILPTPSLFEENMMSALNSFLLFNRAEIVNCLQEDRRFQRELFSQLADESTTAERYRELAHLLREVCTFSLAIELDDRTKFYQKLCSFGFMSAVEGMLTSEDSDVVATVVDILIPIAESISSIVRDHILSQTETHDEDSQFLNVVIGLLVDGQYTEIDVQLVGLVRSLIDPENIMTETASQTVEKSLFLNYFYKHSMHRLMAPLMAQTSGDKVSKDTAQNTGLLSNILDLLSLCVERHTYHIRHYIIDKNILARVLVLMTSSHKYLALAALRFCRRIVSLKDEYYNRYIVRNNLFAPIIKAFMANGQRYNLLNSAIIELFEYINTEKVKTLMEYVIENFMPTLEQVVYVDTFKKFKLRYEQDLERKENKPEAAVQGILYGSIEAGRFRREPRQLDEDEEAWFDEEEESSTKPAPSYLIRMGPENFAPEEAVTSSPTIEKPPVASSPTPSPSPFTTVSYSPRPAGALSRISANDTKPPTISAALQSLADYDEDSDEENTAEEVSPSPVKRQKFDST